MELGISTFGEIPIEHIPGGAKGAQQRIGELLKEAALADELGLDVFALGEHHRPDYVVSAPEVVLAGIAAITKRIRLSSAVTVLSSADPVRVFQNFATLDLISKGRAEIMAGRGSFIESFPLFGYDLDDYDELFKEKLELLMKINSNETVSWQGQHRAPLERAGIYPRPYQQQIPIWLAVGGTPASVARAGTLNLPLTIAILGGKPAHFLPLIKLYREAATKAGHDSTKLQFALNQHTYIADSSDQAADEFWPMYGKMMNRIGRERGWSPMTRDQFEFMRAPGGSLMVGTAQEVADKILAEYQLFGNIRFLAQTIAGELPHEKLMHSLKLFATKVAPVVREEAK
ncbi:MAG: oxidoreductase protein [Flavipsychrobacter sp.]|jgi:probable LLM family oxidoreductase|nr:oxidoreductase protein [Flavipsychrobacter sp.]